jgi:hypothetical protein
VHCGGKPGEKTMQQLVAERTTDTGLVPNGVYIGMPEDQYHADPALGSGDIRQLFLSPQNWKWRQADNPLRDFEPETSAMRFGRAVHALALEGRQAFESRFIKKPEMPPGCLTTADELKEHCKKLGLKVTGTKLELAERIREVDHAIQLEPLIMQDFDQRKGGKTILPDADYARIVMAAHNIRENPYLIHSFTGGFPEVSVFWEQQGVRVKARIDYLRPNECIDLKSMAPWRNETMDESWNRTLRTSRYDMQAAHYMTGRMMINQFVAEGKLFSMDGERPSDDWLMELEMSPDPAWLWVVYQSTEAPIAKGFRMPMGLVIAERAMRDVQKGIENYKMFKSQFGDGQWPCMEPIKNLSDEDMPPWWVHRQEID